MKLKDVQVRLYRNIIDSTRVPIDDSIICLVGKNESGKTAFLEALYSLNPAHPNMVRVDVVRDYPRWRKVRDERERSLEDIVLVRAVFSLAERELVRLHNKFGLSLPASTEVMAERTYNDDLKLGLMVPESELVRLLLESGLVDDSARYLASDIDTIEALLSLAEEQLATEDGRKTTAKNLKKLISSAREMRELLQGHVPDQIAEELRSMLPVFFYFSEYSSLPGRVDLTSLLDKRETQLKDHEQTALSLLHLVGVEGKEFIESDFEVRIAELEAAANEITRQIFEYWTQNTDLIVRFQGDSEVVPIAQGQKVVHKFLDVRLDDQRHHMTTNFETRSTGFQWFFSFIVAFSEFEDEENLIILLDEPGLGLHARAQGDLLRFIEERLGSSTQVIYTTHSPFMVSPKHLERVRLVEDLTTRQNPDIGAKISEDVLSVGSDTLFPLQAALGYDIAQNLFVGGYNLVVEGPSDLVFISTISDYLETNDRVALDPRWTIIPVGGADKIPTFAALLGAHVDFTVLVDEGVARNQRLQDMIRRGLLDVNRLISVGQITDTRKANIEDLFTPDEYVQIYNEAYGDSVEASRLEGTDSIIRQIEREKDADFSHLRPASVFLRNKDTHLGRLSEGTLQRFENLFRLVNNTMSES